MYHWNVNIQFINVIGCIIHKDYFCFWISSQKWEWLLSQTFKDKIMTAKIVVLQSDIVLHSQYSTTRWKNFSHFITPEFHNPGTKLDYAVICKMPWYSERQRSSTSHCRKIIPEWNTIFAGIHLLFINRYVFASQW